MKKTNSLADLSGSSHGYSGSESGTDTAEEPLPARHRARRVKHRSSSSDFLRAISKLDTRSVPKPGLYDTSSGQSFRQFLSCFEEYCKHTFRGSRNLWVGELGRFLRGEMLQAFKALQVSGDSYDTVKHKLLQWRKDSKESYEADTKDRFTHAKPYPNESLRLYAARLEKFFRLAYPNKCIENSSTLRRKYLQSVPIHFQNQLQSARSIALTMNDREITWSNILALTSRYDAQKHSVQQDKGPVGMSDFTPEVDVYGEWKQSGGPVTRYEGNDHFVYQASHPTPPQSSSYRDFVKPKCREGLVPRAKSSSLGQARFTGPRSSSVPRPPRHNLSASDSQRTRFHCTYCRKSGHEHPDCWRRLGRCLVCGSSSHLIAECPNRRMSRPQVSSGTTQSLANNKSSSRFQETNSGNA